MKIIFLDFDGVILTLRSLLSHESDRETVDKTAVDFIANLCRLHGVMLVVSSSWREEPKSCMSILEATGLRDFLHEDWATPIHADSTDNPGQNTLRGEEIRAWLSKHPDIDSYRIIDDDINMLSYQMKYLIKCDSDNGLSAFGMVGLLAWADPSRLSRKREAIPLP